MHASWLWIIEFWKTTTHSVAKDNDVYPLHSAVKPQKFNSPWSWNMHHVEVLLLSLLSHSLCQMWKVTTPAAGTSSYCGADFLKVFFRVMVHEISISLWEVIRELNTAATSSNIICKEIFAIRSGFWVLHLTSILCKMKGKKSVQQRKLVGCQPKLNCTRLSEQSIALSIPKIACKWESDINTAQDDTQSCVWNMLDVELMSAFLLTNSSFTFL